MNKINRRKFLEKAILYNGSIVFGASWFTSGFNYLFPQSASDYYLPIQPDNPSIARYEKNCKGCRECIPVCRDVQKVYGTYNSSKTHHVCINCGACLRHCKYGAMSEKYNWEDVLAAIDDPSKIVIASISPAVPAGIGDYFEMPAGSYLSGNIISACRSIGFDYVLDTNFSADLTIMEEAHELQKRIEEKASMPQFTSCCPAWVKYVEMYYPSLINHLSTTKSPIGMQGTLVKTYFAQKNELDPENIIHVAIAPCTAKKYEITREELGINGMPSTDFVLTTNELAMMVKSRDVDLSSADGTFDPLMGTASGGGKLFGNTGGVMTAAIRTAHFNITGKNPSGDLIELKDVQGLSGMKSAEVNIDGTTVKVGVCYEMRNAQPLLEQIIAGTCDYDFIEVMACAGGCVGGAGQPALTPEILASRIKALESADSQATTRFCHENPEIKAIYKEFLGEPGGPVAEQYLHTEYFDKSSLLEPALAENRLAAVI